MAGSIIDTWHHDFGHTELSKPWIIGTICGIGLIGGLLVQPNRGLSNRGGGAI